MQQTIIYALDFDGVICDSAVETGITGWKAAAELWKDMSTAYPPDELVDRFRLVRPIIETGYESILVMRMLFDGEHTDAILAHFPDKKQHTLDELERDSEYLKTLFGRTRDVWIRDSSDEWIRMNPMFPGVAEKLRRLAKQGIWYIVTTKQERFVKQILACNQIELPDHRIFGLDRSMSKEEVLIDLLGLYPAKTIHFVEDRLPTLLTVMRNDQLKDIRLFCADWGYNTVQDRRDARANEIELIDIDHFLA